MIARRLLLFLHLALVLAATRAETTTNFDVDPVWLRLETALDYFPPRLLKKHRIILKQSIFFTQDRGALGRYGPDHFPGLPFSGGREKESSDEAYRELELDPPPGEPEDPDSTTTTSTSSDGSTASSTSKTAKNEKRKKTGTTAAAWNRNSWQYHPFRLYLPRKDAISPAKMKYLEPLPEDSSDDAVPWVQFSSGAEVVRLLEEVCEDDEEVLAEDFNSRGPSDEIFNLAPQRVALKKLVQLVLEKRREQSQTRQSVQMMVRRWEDVMREVAFPQDILDMDVYLEERNVDHLNKQTNLYDFLPGRARLLAAKDPRTGHFSLDGANTEAKDGRNLPLSVSSPFFNTANEKGEPRPRDVFYPAFYDSLIDLVFDYFGSDRGLFCGLMPRPGIIASCGNNYGRLYEHVLKLKGKIQRRCEGRTRGGRGAGADISSPEESDTPVLRLLEIGIGSVTPQNPGGPMTWMKQFVNRNYVPGHGLRSWRAIFPRAVIYGFDIDPHAVAALKGQRNIKTAVVNSMNKTSIERFVHSEIALARTKVGVRGTTLHAKQDLTEEQERGGNGKRKNEGKNVVSGRGGAEVFTAEQEDEVLDPTSDSKGFFDVIIDDGLHTGISVLSSFVFLYPYLKKNGLYFWEDIRPFITDLSLFSKYLFFGEPEEYQESLETHSDRLKWASSGLGAADGDLIALIRRNSEVLSDRREAGSEGGPQGEGGIGQAGVGGPLGQSQEGQLSASAQEPPTFVVDGRRDWRVQQQGGKRRRAGRSSGDDGDYENAAERPQTRDEDAKTLVQMGNEHHPYGRRAGGSGQDGQEGGRGTRSTTQQTATSSPQDGGGLPYTGDAVDALHDDLYRVGSERDWAADGSVHFVTKFRTYMDSCRMRYMMRFDYGNDTEWWEANRFSLDRPTVGWFHPKDWDHWPLQVSLSSTSNPSSSSSSSTSSGSAISVSTTSFSPRSSTFDATIDRAAAVGFSDLQQKRTLNMLLSTRNSFARKGDAMLAASSSSSTSTALSTSSTTTSATRMMITSSPSLLLESRLLYHKYLRDDGLLQQMQCFDQVHTYERCCKGNDPTDEGKADCFAYLELALTTHQYAVVLLGDSHQRRPPDAQAVASMLSYRGAMRQPSFDRR
eukprot:CAMPEP_0178986618 /NCGR_PEP_ID=MMETSP0795-20121207/2802_1 /TAXON_ID=88552 /ORGANISM="Amoebophrya sp., Strain Ameob2" /LENGTH=1118 /DNA_ID=CAMNT_0020677695 /DNA_START=242 /DNA_END=3600 /DNA_ORIENTATION=+